MKCHLCGDEWPDAEGVGDHFRIMHPGLDVGFERWPDGGVVVHDGTLTPEDFA